MSMLSQRRYQTGLGFFMNTILIFVTVSASVWAYTLLSLTNSVDLTTPDGDAISTLAGDVYFQHAPSDALLSISTQRNHHEQAVSATAIRWLMLQRAGVSFCEMNFQTYTFTHLCAGKTTGAGATVLQLVITLLPFALELLVETGVLNTLMTLFISFVRGASFSPS